jgi:Fe-S-cluster containining protein
MTPAAPPFARTVCSCAECTACCHRQPGSLAPGELEAIAAHLDKPVNAVLAKFWASPGALLLNSLTGQTFRQGTITPRLKDGRCVFLDAADRCTIHAVAPFGCAYFDTHMTAAEAQPRGVWLARAQADPAYQSLRRTLAPAASYRPSGY